MKINKYFDKIYLLNLHRRLDRLESSTDRLNQFGIKFDTFNGVDGQVIEFLWKKLNNEYFSNKNYVACCVSHLSIYNDALKNGYKKILILEDDNLINRDIHLIFESIDIPEWDDLFYLGYIPLNDDCSMWDYKYGLNNLNVINKNFFSPSNLWGLYAYGITNTLMLEMVDIYNNQFPMEIDRYFVNNIQKRGKSIAISPQLFCCDDNILSDNLNYIPQNMKVKSIDSRMTSLDNYI